MEALRRLVVESGRAARGWIDAASSDFCGTPDCGTWFTWDYVEGLQLPGGIPDCAWEGVACRGYRVVSIVLPCGSTCNAPIRGQLPQSLPGMDALQRLVLDRNALSGTLPPWSGWKHMEVGCCS